MRSLGLLALPLLAVACGGNVASTGPGSNDHPEPQTHLPSGSIVGSFNLAFTKVTATSKFAGTPPSVAIPSKGSNARIDIGSGTSNSDVTIAPEWGDPAHYASTVTSSSVALDSGQAVVSSDDSFYVRDAWTSFTLGRTADGGLDGTFTAIGSEEITEGDVAYENDLTATGTITPDTTPPDVKTTGPSGTVLPWEPIYVRVSEPIASPFSTVLSLDAGGSHGKVADDPTATSTTALLSSWASTTATLSAISFKDPSGNASIPKSIPISFFDPGAPAASFSFDSASSNPAKWDDAGLVKFLGSDPSCESGGCAVVGPIGNNGCTVPSIGVAGVLSHDASHAGTVFVRYRILVRASSTEGGGEIIPDAQVFSVETATPGATPSTQTFGFATSDLKTIPDTFGFTQATDWQTASVSTAAASQIGFGLRFGSNSYCGGPIFNANETVVLVDSVTTN